MKSIIYFLILALTVSCNKKNSSGLNDINNTSITTEQKILQLLPNDFTESGYSKSGIFSGDCEIYINNNVLNITYLILENQITERGIAKDLVLTSNDEGTMMLVGKWDNQDAGDGKVIIHLKEENRVYIEVDGLDGASWWYKAECTIPDKDYDKLFYLFNGYKQIVQKEESKYVKPPDSLNSGANSSNSTKNVDLDNQSSSLSNNEDKEKVNKTIIGE